MIKNIIITGGTKGLGKSLFKQLGNELTNLFIIGRNIEDLNRLLIKTDSNMKSINVFKYDLSETKNLDNLIKSIIKNIDYSEREMIVFINNAGTIKPIKRLGLLKNHEIEYNLKLNCISPILLINSFINRTIDLFEDIRIINITSGVIKKPLSGWSLYSSSKAAVNTFIETIYYEQKHSKKSIKVVSFDPGVMNTDMQKYIRTASKENFSKVDEFKELHEEGLLRSTDDVAILIEKIYIDNWFAKDTFETIWKYENITEDD